MTREERQAQVDQRVRELRAAAKKKQDEADRLHGTVETDHAFWTQPIYGNAAGRAFARRRDRERSKLMKAAEIAASAREMLAKADAMESRGAVVAGDAAKERAAKVAACNIAVGQTVDTTHFGFRKVLKVNTKTVLVEGSFGPIKVEKQYLRVAA